MKAIYFVLPFLLLAESCFSNELIVSYAPSASVKADKDEGDIDRNHYAILGLDSGLAKGIRWVPTSDLYYVDFSLLDSGRNLLHETGQEYMSLSAGLRFAQDYTIDEDLHAYLGCTAGIGAAKFSVERSKTRSMAEASFKGGLVFSDRFTVGPEVKFQFVGRPGETAARVIFFNINAGIRF
uniref:hypothetical protein n=1 Tax=Microbulbifer agarilyticus TaxID=260552 RepID=UPI00025582ED|nr:hypothetical protein [Microbulbifer agarilyticus]